MLSLMLKTALVLAIVHTVHSASPSWVSLNVSVPPFLQELDYNFNLVDVLVGTPPQLLSLPIDMQGDILTVYSNDCQFCGGTTFYDPSQSSTSTNVNRSLNGTSTINGTWMTDTVSLGGVVETDSISLAMVEMLSTGYDGLRVTNGGFGFLADTPRNTSVNRFIPALYQSGQLFNPVVGMRLDTLNPRLTVGALDPNDFEGEINWVPLEPNTVGDNLYNRFNLDGIVGRNGSFVPYGDNLIGGISSLLLSIAVPDNTTYINNTGFSGPLYNDTLNLELDTGAIGVPCNDSDDTWGPGVHVPPAYLDFNVQINGVKYMVDSQEIVRNLTYNPAPPGFCHIGLITNAVQGKPDVWLGLPFLRSVYFAYRFPTGDCPGYYGFAFPKGANRTQEQIAQKPTSTPALASHCLNFVAPTSTPTVMRPVDDDGPKYTVYGNSDGLQVPLKGVEFLVKGIWNITS
ncbi:hypothetical protein EIP91_011304 [Steccherinum ochraceum]|uniref:Peptidase A1 domain-containing protein n=1 Tax=Steccherinum ochraceum TaxID=92696 RepID=A0A4R0RPZ4_9APHY|nr:hypothetical protein EIP91_011304 [Steccherinum ochraceum]